MAAAPTTALQELELTIRTVTPAFLRRAKGQPELRPPSFRGLFRYWFRACAGAVIQMEPEHMDPEQSAEAVRVNRERLIGLESSVWGNTEQASSVVLNLWEDGFQAVRTQMLPHENMAPERAIPAWHKVTVVLRPRARSSAEVWAAAGATVRLALMLGGIGARSRRGFGSCMITAEGDRTIPRPATLPDWQQRITDTLKAALDATRELADSQGIPTVSTAPDTLADFPRLSQKGRLYLGREAYATPEDALSDLMHKLNDIRATTGMSLGSGTPRRASPVWGRVLRVGDTYHLLFSVLASNLIPNLNYEQLHAALAPLAEAIVKVP